MHMILLLLAKNEMGEPDLDERTDNVVGDFEDEVVER